jgi:outer membrane murein-binding lipoprotein Lpp
VGTVGLIFAAVSGANLVLGGIAALLHLFPANTQAYKASNSISALEQRVSALESQAAAVVPGAPAVK